MKSKLKLDHLWIFIFTLMVIFPSREKYSTYQLGMWNARLSNIDSLKFQNNFDLLRLEGISKKDAQLGAGFNNMDSIKAIILSGGKIHLNGKKLLKELKIRKIKKKKSILTSKKEVIIHNSSKKIKKIGVAPKRIKDIAPLTRKNYIKKFTRIAKAEENKYGIPYKVILVQAITEGGAGTSTLSLKYNNHFGIKCHSKRCKKGHCTNFTDDSHKDFFRIYKSAWSSYRSHSILLQKERYKWLKKLKYKDYISSCKRYKRKIKVSRNNWIKLSKDQKYLYGLDASGYATDKEYAEKMLRILKKL